MWFGLCALARNASRQVEELGGLALPAADLEPALGVYQGSGVPW
ncbi:hypothetical protein ACJRW5_19175 [Pseudomonas sp. SH1-B]